MARKRDRDGSADTVATGRLTPVDIQQVRFRVAMRGYDERDVDVFLDRVTEEIARLIEEKAALAAGGSIDIGSAGSEEYERALATAREDAERVRAEMDRYRLEAEGLRAQLEGAGADIATNAEATAELERARDEASAMIRRATAESAEIVRRGMEQAAAMTAGGDPQSATIRRDEVHGSLAPFLNREREFLQSLGSIVQAHAEEIRSMVVELRARSESATGTVAGAGTVKPPAPVAPGVSAPPPPMPPDSIG